MVDALEAAAFLDFSDAAFFAVLGIRKVFRGCSYFLKNVFFFGIAESFFMRALHLGGQFPHSKAISSPMLQTCRAPES